MIACRPTKKKHPWLRLAEIEEKVKSGEPADIKDVEYLIRLIKGIVREGVFLS